MTATEETYTSPPRLAEYFGVGEEKIGHWIKTGQLRAINIALRPGRRPRWRVAWSAVREFEAARAAQPAVPIQRRRRQRADGNFVQYV
jgi:hypothetical protein